MTPTEEHVKILSLNGFRNTTEKSWPNHFQWRSEGKYKVPNVKVRMSYGTFGTTRLYIMFDYIRIIVGVNNPHIYEEVERLDFQTLKNILTWFNLSPKQRRDMGSVNLVKLHEDVEYRRNLKFKPLAKYRKLIEIYDSVNVQWVD